MSERTKVTRYVEGPDEHSIGHTKITVTDFEDGTCVVRRDFEFGGFYSQVALDGNNNMLVEWRHGGGTGKVRIPDGECFDIYDALRLMNLGHRNLFSKRPIYREIAQDESK